MTVRLRSHHLLCMLTYVGKGYSPAFTANYDLIVARIGNGEDILIVSGPDDICAPLLNEERPHCHGSSVLRRDHAAARAVSFLLSLSVRAGVRFTLDGARISSMRRAFAQGELRRACKGCPWNALCNDVSVAGYNDVRLLPC